MEGKIVSKKHLIVKIKEWKIKRKSEAILCPYCLHDYHKVVKWIKKQEKIYSRPIFKCCQCDAFFNHNGKRLRGDRFTNKILKNAERKIREVEFKLNKEITPIIKKYLISSKKHYQEGLNKILETIVFGCD